MTNTHKIGLSQILCSLVSTFLLKAETFFVCFFLVKKGRILPERRDKYVLEKVLLSKEETVLVIGMAQSYHMVIKDYKKRLWISY